MAAFQTFQSFFLKLGEKVIDLDTDTLKIYLSDDAPNVATDTVKADVTEIANVHGYAGPIDINNAYALSGGIGVVTGDASETVTAVGGSVGPFRYVVLYDSTAAAGPLIGFWDYGAELTLGDTQTFTVQFGASILTVKNP